jgi:hypothetical protein
MGENIPNDQKRFLRAIKLSNGRKIIPKSHKIYQQFPLQGPSKYLFSNCYFWYANIPSGNPGVHRQE